MGILRPTGEWLFKVLALAAVYAVAGRAGLLLAVPPEVATGVFPPAGIAMAAVLLWGYAVWPGVMLGVILMELPIDPLIEQKLLYALCISSGSAAQAVLGAWLVRRFVQFPTPLNDGSSVGKFVVLSGPVACLTAASWCIPTLWLFGALTHDLAYNWFTWWVGDTIGVVVFVPLLLIAFGRPRTVWRTRRLSVGLPLVAAFIAVTGLFYYAQQEQASNTRLEFVRRASAMNNALTKQVESYLEVVHAVAMLFQSTDEIDRREFKTFVDSEFARHPGLIALGWIPRVTSSERHAFEQAARNDALRESDPHTRKELEQFTIKQWRSDTKWAPFDGEHDETHFPVYYLEPYRSNENALGIDLASNPDRRAAIVAARDTGQPAATAPVVLAQEKGSERGFLIVAPIYAPGTPTATVQQRRANLVGYASGVFRMWDIVNSSLSESDRTEVELNVFDESMHWAPPELLYGAPRDDLHDGHSRQQMGLQQVMSHKVGGRKWRLEFTPREEYLLTHRNARMELVFGGAGMLIIIFCASLLLVASRSESTLRESELRFRSIFELAAVGIAQVATDGRFLRVNQRLCEILGYNSDELLATTFQNITHPDDLDMALQNVRRALDGGIDSYSLEKRYVRKDGTALWAKLTVALVRDDADEFKYYVSVVEDISQRKRAEDELQKEQDLLRKLIELQETERQMVAHDIHDGLTQDVVGAHMALQGVGEQNADEAGYARVQRAEQLLTAAIKECRRMIRDLRPMILDEAGVVDAIEHQVAEENTRAGLTVAFRHDVRFTRLDPKLEGAIFRIVQEAISNVRRHGQTEHAAVELIQDNGALEIVVRDRGVGFDPNQVSAECFGLRGIRERARLFGGEAEITSTPGDGATVYARLPIDDASAE